MAIFIILIWKPCDLSGIFYNSFLEALIPFDIVIVKPLLEALIPLDIVLVKPLLEAQIPEENFICIL